MKASTFFKAASLLSPLFAPTARAQDKFTHPGTGIEFYRTTISDTQTTGGFEWGYALPGAPTGDNDEYIGYIKGSTPGGNGWAGISHGGAMPNDLLLVAWPEGTKVAYKFVYATGYIAPEDYTGKATLTTISQTVTADHFELVYRCQQCWVWNQNGADGQQKPDGAEGVQIVAWAQHLTKPGATWVFHNNGQGIFGAPVASARNAKYFDWAGNGTGPEPPTTTSAPPTAPTTCVGTPAPTAAYDYIVVGGGAGGIPVADKLSEAGKSVLLIEKGPPSLGRYSGVGKAGKFNQPGWLSGTSLTRFDVPGLCNQIWVDSAGVACTDIDQMAGCVLGGGAAVNAALWWRPVPVDWDTNFPSGWKSADVKRATDSVFKRIPGTDTPSKDGKRYKQEGFEVLKSAFVADGWKEVTANNVPAQKNRVFSHSPFMYENGQRQGPLGAHLVTAMQRTNFKLWTNTAVRRVLRTGGKATGVELAGGDGGYCGTVNLKPGGRVILSSGAFGTPKLLFRSGIGPKAQLEVVKNSVQDGPTFINQTQWIELPVGQNLNDHVNTDLVVRHPNVSFYNFYTAWDEPPATDKTLYLQSRAGILAQSAPNIGPLAWEVIKGTDGIDRSIQWTARVEGPGANDTNHMTISQYLGRGSTSRGALSINGALNIFVSKAPYLQTAEDRAAIITSIKNMKTAMSKNPDITFTVPPAGVTVEDYVDSLPKTPSARRANHWIGTAKLGTDSGLKGGTSVVDLNTQVYGTQNIHVVDASIFPGHIVTNPTSYIVVAAEHAAAKILALGSSSSKRAGAFEQCGGPGWTGPTQCVAGFLCRKQTAAVSRCLPA